MCKWILFVCLIFSFGWVLVCLFSWFLRMWFWFGLLVCLFVVGFGLFFFTNLSCLIQLCLETKQHLVELKGYLIPLMEFKTLNRPKSEGNVECAFLAWLLLVILRKYEEQSESRCLFSHLLSSCGHASLSSFTLKSLFLYPVCETLAHSLITISWLFL